MAVTRRFLAPAAVLLALGVLAGCEDASLDALTGTGGTVAADHLDPDLFTCELIDFEDVSAGTSVSTVTAAGVTFTITTPVLNGTSVGAAIYDSDAPIGNDPDLEDTGLCTGCEGNLLILQEDGNTVPDDSDGGGVIRFDFDVAEVIVADFDAVDQDESPTAEGVIFTADGTESETMSGLTTDGGVELVDIDPDALANDFFEFEYTGSGAVDNIEVCVEKPGDGGGEGCTPGYWKQSQHFDSWSDEFVPEGATATLFGSIFTCDGDDIIADNGKNRKLGIDGESVCDITLLEALNAAGGGVNALARHAVAALLNTTNGEVSYDLSESEVITLVNGALATDQYGTAKNTLAGFNEQGCPLN